MIVQSLNDSSIAYVIIKTVKQSLPQENEDFRQKKELQDEISRLQKNLDSAKNLIQQGLVQQRIEDVGLDVGTVKGSVMQHRYEKYIF